MRLGVGYCFYNDLKSIQRSVPTFINEVDLVLAVDGKFSLRDGSDYSTDGSTEYLDSFDNVIINKFVGMEHDKRQQYIEMAKKYDIDYIIIIDSDEYINDANWDIFRENLEKNNDSISGVKFYYTDKDYTSYPRIWKTGHVNYWKTHNIFEVDGSLVRSPPNLKTIEGISMSMNDDLRDDDYLLKTSEYQSRMLDYEIPLRHALRDGKLGNI